MCEPPPLRVTCGFLIQLVFCIKICFHHQSVTPFLGAAPCHKKNPGPAPDFVLVSAMVSAKTRIFYCDLSKPCCYYWGPVRVKFWQATWPYNSDVRLDEMVTNNTKLGWNCDREDKNHKYNGKTPTATRPALQLTEWPLLKFRLGAYIRVFNKSRWPAKFARYFTWTHRLLFFGNYPSLNKVFMCRQWIKKRQLNDVYVLFKHSHFCFRMLEMHPKRPRFQSFSRKSCLYCQVFLPHLFQSFCHLLEILLKTLYVPFPPPPKRASLFFSNTSISTKRNSWDTPTTYFCLPRPRRWELVFWMHLL